MCFWTNNFLIGFFIQLVPVHGALVDRAVIHEEKPEILIGRALTQRSTNLSYCFTHHRDQQTRPKNRDKPENYNAPRKYQEENDCFEEFSVYSTGIKEQRSERKRFSRITRRTMTKDSRQGQIALVYRTFFSCSLSGT